MDRTIVNAAVVQAAPVLFDTARTLSRLRDLIRDAASNGSDIVVFPEAFVGGYPKGLDFGARVGSRSPEGRDEFLRYYNSAIEIPGEECAAIGAMARAHKIYVVVGVIERAGATLYCSALTFSPDGNLINRHRKLMPTASERLIWGFGDGSMIGVAETEIGRIGSVNLPGKSTCPCSAWRCTRRASNSIARPPWTIARPGCRPCGRSRWKDVVSSCRRANISCARNALMITRQFREIDPQTVLIRGGSCIIDPLGQVLAAPVFDAELIQYAELDRRLIAKENTTSTLLAIIRGRMFSS